ncbi:MAG: hypothetical protein IJX55_02820, partial [Clostridia bacterium]|nr:hypothetical protein [Clostridia bacterium]
MKKTDFIKQIFLFAICFFFANIFAVFIYAQVYTYILRAFGIGEYAGHIAYCAGIFVSHFHMAYIFIYGNSAARRNFFEFKRKIFRSPFFWVANAVFFALTLAFAPNFAFFHITSALFPGKTLSFIAKKLIISFVMLFVDFGLIFLANSAACAKWRAEGEESDTSRGVGAIFLRVLAAFLFYLFLLGIAIRFTVTMAFYTGVFFRVLLFFVPALVVFFAFFALLSYIKRKRFESKIKVLCE